MTDYTFDTPERVELYFEIESGSVDVVAQPTGEATVRIEGQSADEVEVGLDGTTLSIIGPKHRAGFLRGDRSLKVHVTVPVTSDVTGRTGSADTTASGSLGALRFKTGSGDLRCEVLEGPSAVETGSGDVTVDDAVSELKVKSGSGDVAVHHAVGGLSISTGSGDVRVGTSESACVVRTGSGDLEVERSRGDLAFSTGSGDLAVRAAHRGKLTLKGASGDINVGVPGGTPVWTDINTISGAIRSNLAGAGEPAEGQDFVEVRAKTVSGDISLIQI